MGGVAVAVRDVGALNERVPLPATLVSTYMYVTDIYNFVYGLYVSILATWLEGLMFTAWRDPSAHATLAFARLWHAVLFNPKNHERYM